MHSRNRVIIFICLASVAVIFVPLAAGAQVQQRVRLVDTVRTRPPASTGPKIIRRPVTVTKIETRVVTKTEKVKISSLAVSTEPGAKVILETKGVKPIKTEIMANDKGSAIFDDLKPGVYRLVSSKDEFESVEADKVTINPQKAHSLNMDLKQVTYKLKIQTNLAGGDIRFAPAIETGKNAAGGITSRQLGSYCVVRISPTGEAVISDLKKGYYDVDIIPDTLEFETKEAGVNVPEDIDQDDGSTSVLKTFQVDLEKNISKEEFTTSWIQAEWTMPQAWRLDRGLKVRSDGIALPQNERYRQYVDFEMIANVKLNDEGTVGFVLRAKNARNYYLLHISGDKGVEKNTATLRAVKDGVVQPESLASATIPHFAKTLSSDSGFRVTIQGDRKGFTVWIEDSKTGKGGAVGLLTDQYNTNKKGAVGIAGAPKSDFDVSFFRVCPSRCK